ncbi:MAG TPA: 1-(5-phosphoribosyl)-5-[(5-phosphoribosylamino)methylideneamino]imidazole-4-carboxamide isomerase [Saprospiraceae bacterium]|nr:1-(5-phosphoribosyl)-5-[(5-phosphoribosylamino)methylideneamino]imidazole-4-carboxamide isomerase [Saprospiraceae bacterium]
MNIIIPAIDIMEGKCVRLTQGDYQWVKMYHEDPMAIAQQFVDYGASKLHIVDLDAARSGKPVNHGLISRLIVTTGLNIQVGGGIRTYHDVKVWLDSGAERVIIGSTAQKEKELTGDWVGEFGSSRIVIGADVKKEKIAVHGWEETSEDNIEEFITYYRMRGAVNFLCTDIEKDGMLQGPSWDLYQRLIHLFPDIQLIASGGVASMLDIEQLIKVGIREVVVGKAIYEGKITMGRIFK